jgi:teichuronic acid biosynthesis protein TuaE
MLSSLMLPRQQSLEKLFYAMIAFALLGPTLGVKLVVFKLTFFRVAFFALAVALILRWVNDKSIEASHMYRIRWYWAFFAFWVAYAAISLTWVIDLGKGIKYLTFLLMMTLLCLSFPFFAKTEKQFWQTMRTLFWVFFAIVAFGFFESITFFHLPSSRYWGKPVSNVTSVFQNQNDLATAITLALPFIGTALYMLKASRRTKVLTYITVVVALYCLLATGSRSNTMMALPLILLVWAVSLLFTVDREKLKKNFLRGMGVFLSIVLIVGLLNVTLLSGGENSARAKLASTFGIFLDLKGDWNVPTDQEGIEKGEGTGGTSITVRKNLLLYGLHYLQESNYMGVGAGNVEAHNETNLGKGINKVNIHNWWAEVLVNFGVLIFVMYMVLYFGLLRRLWRLASIKRSPHVSPLIRWGALSSLLSLTGFFIGGVAPSSCIHFTPMWISYGVALAVVVLGEQQRKKAEQETEATTVNS